MSVYDDIKIERDRQDRKWGEQNHDDGTWSLILGEEVGEACEAALSALFGGGQTDALRDELVQIAAVATAWIECLDRRNDAPKEAP